MQIDRAAIFRFGKLADRTVDFAPGINIVYGKNEAGKTTLHAFLTAMLFGLEKGRDGQRGRRAICAMSRGMHRPITAVRCSLASEADRFIWNAIFTIKNREHASATWRTGRNCPSRTEILECF